MSSLGKPCKCLHCDLVMYRKRFYDHVRSRHKDLYEKIREEQGGSFKPQEDKDFTYQNVDTTHLTELSGTVAGEQLLQLEDNGQSGSCVSSNLLKSKNALLKKKNQITRAVVKDEDSSDSESEDEDIKRPSRAVVVITRGKVAAAKPIKRETVESSSCSTEKSWGKKKPAKSRSRSVVTKKNDKKQ